eukprot:scaffold32244_cov60-Attheya_sp.AAC.3
MAVTDARHKETSLHYIAGQHGGGRAIVPSYVVASPGFIEWMTLHYIAGQHGGGRAIVPSYVRGSISWFYRVDDLFRFVPLEEIFILH